MNPTEQSSAPSIPVPDSFTTPHFAALLDQCIHCGLCLPACPTYTVYHTEMDNPRGRIALMRGVADGHIAITSDSFQKHIERCLGCRACETACPSGVHYGALFEEARAAIHESRAQTDQIGSFQRAMRWLTLSQLLAHPARLRWLARLLAFYQRMGADRIVRRFIRLPPSLRVMESLLPPVTTEFPDYAQPAPAHGTRRGTVAFLHGCVQDAFLSDVNAATIRVLQRNGYAVHVLAGQTCCGAAPLHMGDRKLARAMARRNIDALAPALAGTQYDAIITNAGGCGATLKEYAQLLRDDPEYAARAETFVAKLYDISEFLAERLHAPPRGRLNARVTYVDSCHLRHAQRVVQPPRALLAAIPGVEFVELQRPDLCCGSAGVYNILQADTAAPILHAKMADVAATGAQIIVTTNTGCHMQMLHGVRQKGLDAEVVHLVQLLDRAYQIDN